MSSCKSCDVFEHGPFQRSSKSMLIAVSRKIVLNNKTISRNKHHFNDIQLEYEKPLLIFAVSVAFSTQVFTSDPRQIFRTKII
jgi:hypothetical protein